MSLVCVRCGAARGGAGRCGAAHVFVSELNFLVLQKNADGGVTSLPAERPVRQGGERQRRAVRGRTLLPLLLPQSTLLRNTGAARGAETPATGNRQPRKLCRDDAHTQP